LVDAEKTVILQFLNDLCYKYQFKKNKLELPIERPLSGTEGPNVPRFFVGDEGFVLNRNTLRLLVDLT
jgi:hypothetical protein